MRLFVGEALRSRLTNTGNDLVPDSVNPVKDRFIQRINAQIVIVDTREKVAFKILVEPFYLSLCLGTADPAPAWRKAVVAGKGRQPLVWLPALTVVNPGGLHVVIEYLGGNPAKIPEGFLMTGKKRRAGHVGGKACQVRREFSAFIRRDFSGYRQKKLFETNGSDFQASLHTIRVSL